jgi:hypothetical protein
MDLWADLERRIRERAVRVEERLALVARLRAADAEARLLARRAELVAKVERARDALQLEALRR